MEIIEAPVDVDIDAADEPCTAESAECTCPDFCERDHEQD
jgi:hypothetical protein